ncbi:2,3-bisphosphoglycerate-independent phosphoglycerate mutase [Ichthyobacterium seriolicida]|uniref:2,3-bisphosphoglycerate-independent phosphoglycerate mutase n=1 Tax=Ichthyobacterium seriolicida TaxID=242600 RepID=A0A1J1DZT3_9FLAO|nr:2,3-bisphosphoglycerate-independent phosphoglycerate mutase [Ichthyobacterium seriolicida]BAV94189.1 2,3-bisphosphoglycerate-independent phosphoglycerate mutase [Ichthyobacterium seriolicida]
MNKKVLLIILDGWGIAKNKEVSAVDKANTPFIDSLYKNYPNSRLDASGEAVGLPKGQMGNSEVGHMNIGAGRVVYQDLMQINLSIENDSLKDNEILKKNFSMAKAEAKKIHFIGLLSDGGIHSHINHLKALLKIVKEMKLKNVFLHIFTDGRDTDPKSGVKHLEDITQYTLDSHIKISSVIGRYYAMDRDNRWERIKLAYDLMVNAKGEKTDDPIRSIKKSYENGITDEFLNPIVVTDENGKYNTISEGDLVISYNFRTDRCRQITEALSQRDLIEWGMKKINLNYITMTNYDDNFKDIEVIFRRDLLVKTLGEVLSDNGKKQIRIAETEKYPHVTYFFSGGREEEFKGEKRLLCPSPKVATYDLQPSMSARDIRDKISVELQKKEADFICLNFANPDMVGHTGVMQAAIKACETVDECAESVVEVALNNDYTTIIISDHGNSECMINEDGSPNTAHTTSQVPFFLIDKDCKNFVVKNGKLCDVAPTILDILGIPKPEQIDGQSLIS